MRESGGRGRIRTSDRLVRSQVLYPAELRVRSMFRMFKSRIDHVLKTKKPTACRLMSLSKRKWRTREDSNLRPPGS